MHKRTVRNTSEHLANRTENPCVPGSIPGLATISVNMQGVAWIPYAKWVKWQQEWQQVLQCPWLFTDVLCITLVGRGSRHPSRDYRIIVPAPYNFLHKGARWRDACWIGLEQGEAGEVSGRLWGGLVFEVCVLHNSISDKYENSCHPNRGGGNSPKRRYEHQKK